MAFLWYYCILHMIFNLNKDSVAKKVFTKEAITWLFLCLHLEICFKITCKSEYNNTFNYFLVTIILYGSVTVFFPILCKIIFPLLQYSLIVFLFFLSWTNPANKNNAMFYPNF